ncbi:MAG TPA: hypothetical protein VE338_01065 [Ktedonobacterales bacterium]|nr:hypothetical protein [Ktedonobacterales bacterium]
MRRSALDRANEMRKRNRRRKLDEKVDVVFNAAKRDDVNPKLRTLSRDRAMDTLLDLAYQQRQAIPGGPHHMDIDGYPCLPHALPSSSTTNLPSG